MITVFYDSVKSAETIAVSCTVRRALLIPAATFTSGGGGTPVTGNLTGKEFPNRLKASLAT